MRNKKRGVAPFLLENRVQRTDVVRANARIFYGLPRFARNDKGGVGVVDCRGRACAAMTKGLIVSPVTITIIPCINITYAVI